MAWATCSVDMTMMDEKVLGRRCRSSVRIGLAPMARAASTKSFSRSASTSARTTRV
jgi:hypothetical protein